MDRRTFECLRPSLCPNYHIIELSHSLIVTNIDDLMQQKYANDDPNSRFEFREEYWEQALALIEADEARRRKKRRWWWGCLAVLLLTAAGYGAWDIAAKTSAQKQPRQQIEKTTAATSTRLPQQNETSSSARLNQIMPVVDVQHTNDAIQPPNPSAETDNSTNNPDNQNIKNTSTSTEIPRRNDLRASNPDVPPQDNNAEKAAAATKTAQKALGKPDAESTRHDQMQPGGELNRTDTASVIAALAPEHDQSHKGIFAPINTLPLPLDSVQSQQTAALDKPAPVANIAARQTKPIRDSRFTLGFAAAATVYAPAPDKRRLGFSTGAGATYKFAKNWSACAGLGLRFQPGNWRDTAGNIHTESLRYSFGFESLKTSRRDVGLLSLEIPLSVAWHRGAIVAEAGLAPGNLLFALERYQEVQASSLQAAKTTRNRLERGETGIYQRFYTNAFAGLAWRCSAKASICIKGNYRFGAILKATAEDPAMRGGSNVELGLKWAIGW